MHIYMLVIFLVFNRSWALYCNNRQNYVLINYDVPTFGFQDDLLSLDTVAVSSLDYFNSSKYYNSFPKENLQMNDNCKIVNDTFRICSSLETAFGKLILSSTCYAISQNIQLKTNISIVGVTGFTLLGLNNARLECNSSVGIHVINSSDITFSSVYLNGCGKKFLIKSHLIENHYPLISAAICFENVNNFFFDGVTTESSLGYSLIMLNPGSGNFSGCDFSFSKAVQLDLFGGSGVCQYAGGLYIDYYENSKVDYNEKILFQYTYVRENKNNKSNCNMSLGYDTPILNGGGISLFLRHNIRYKMIMFISYTQVQDNEGTSSGGGLYILLEKNSQNNIVQFHQTFIVRNKANKSGGGIQITNMGINNSLLIDDNSNIDLNVAQNGGGLCVNLTSCSINSTITLNKANIQSNKANSTGGGVFIEDAGKNNTVIINQSYIYQNKADQNSGGIHVSSLKKSESNSLYLINSKVYSNQANIGSGMMIYSALFKFENVDIYNCTNKGIQFISQGSIYAVNSILIFYGKNIIKENNFSAVILYFSKIIINGTLIFYKNTGQNGGALALFGQSQIFLKNHSKLSFKENNALKSGGAIYVLVPGPRFRPWLPSPNRKYCFFQMDKTSSVLVNFEKNTANDLKGHDIFISALNTCRSNFEENASSIITLWKGFNFKNNYENSIVTDAVNITVQIQQIKQPGKKSKITVQLWDERQQYVDELVTIKGFGNDVRKFKVNNSVVEVAFYGEANTKVSIIIIAGSISKKVDIALPNCECGYLYNKTNKRCTCSNSTPYDVCTDDFIKFQPNKWIRNKIYPCPINLCRVSSANNSEDDYWFNETNQCISGRDSSSVLCSDCLPNYSVLLYNSSCIKCSGNKNIVFVLVITLGVVSCYNLIIIIANYNSFAWYLIPTVYFYASISQICTAMVNIPPWIVLMTNIVSLLGMNITFDLIPQTFGCIELMNDLNKVLLRVAVLVIWLLSFVIIATLTHYRFHLNKDVIKRSLAIISFIFYCIIIEVSIQLMLYIDIDGEERRLFIAPSQHYFKGPHKWILIFAVVFFVICLMFLVLTFIFSIFYKDEDKINNTIRYYNFLKLKLFITYYIKLFITYFAEGSEKNKRWICCFYFFAKLLMTALIGLGACADVPLLEMWKAVTCLVLLWFLLMVKPYEKIEENIFHILCFTSLSMIASINNSIQFEFSIYNNSTGIFVHYIYLVLAVLPLIFCAYEAIPYCRVRQNNGENNNKCHIPPIADSTELLSSFKS
ncbi:uncharacterized protein LOC136081890 [Hydra vulgaris]|uniref:Uncharacterized protein LOC136081890 n=1 Tax=Hydra vulgaris TaxID=6087 RepID=A0ABM4C424_HYDVU